MKLLPVHHDQSKNRDQDQHVQALDDLPNGPRSAK